MIDSIFKNSKVGPKPIYWTLWLTAVVVVGMAGYFTVSALIAKSEKERLLLEKQQDEVGQQIETMLGDLRKMIATNEYDKAEGLATQILEKREVPEARIARCRLRMVNRSGNMTEALKDAQALIKYTPDSIKKFTESAQIRRLVVLAEMEEAQAGDSYRGFDEVTGMSHLASARAYLQNALDIRANNPEVEQSLAILNSQISKRSSPKE